MKKQITFFGLLIIGLMCGTFSAWAVQDGIVINEVMFMPATGSEWVELYNASGEPRDLDKVWFFDFSKTGNEWKDLTVAANEIDDDFVPVGGMAPKDFLYEGRRDATFQAISVVLGSNVNTIISSIKAEYWNGSDWQDLFATDGTASAGVTLSQNGDITWTVPFDWGATGVNGVSAYYVRLSVDKTLSSNVDVDVTDYRDGLEIDIADYDITNAAEDTYTIPTALPPVPPGAFVVINFDGLGPGADDYDFSDGVAELHSSILTGNVFTDVEDSVILYSGMPHDESTKKDFVAWGDYIQHDNFIDTLPGVGSLRRAPRPGRTIGLHPKMYGGPFKSWVVYLENDTSKGATNPIPTPLPIDPWPNTCFIDGVVSFAWIEPEFNVKSYRLQVDDDPTFNSPIVDIEINTSFYITPTPLPAETYYWRVKAIDRTGESSRWSTIASFVIRAISGSPNTKDLGVIPILKTKDTKLVCLECRRDHALHSWDNVHKNKKHTFSGHSKNYCWAGCIKMMADYYGGSLSMDRIAYEVGRSEAANPEGPKWDLRHGRTASIPQVTDGLKWALTDAGITHGTPKPSFAWIKNHIDINKPFILWVPGHVVVIDGYTEPDIVHYNDPDTGVETKRCWGPVPGKGYWVLTPAIATGRSDEPSISADPDNDGRPRFVSGKWDGKDYNPWGLMTFDEEERFKTDPNKADTDGDCVQDKVEVWSYVFGKGKIARRPDQDGDGIRAEKDSDTDDGGFADGDEDTNLDGDLDAGETDPFKSDDDGDFILVEYFFQGTSPPIPGIDGKGKSWATLALSTDDKKFRFKSADKILGEIDTQKAIVADMWREIPGNPSRIIFTGTNAGVKFYGNVLLENYLRAVVDVTKNNKRVRYLLKACKP
jgi:hypothetical protein